MTIKFSITTVIARQPADVWDFITDFGNAPAWMPGISRVEQLDEGEPGRGSTLLLELKGSSFQQQVSYWELEKCLILSSELHNMPTEESYRLESIADRTELELGIVIDVKGIRLLLLPFIYWSAKRDANKRLQRIKLSLERDIKDS